MQKGPPGSGQVLFLGEVTLCSLGSFPCSLLCEVCFGFSPQASFVPCPLPHHLFFSFLFFTFHSEMRPLCLPSLDAVAFLHTPSFTDPRRAAHVFVGLLPDTPHVPRKNFASKQTQASPRGHKVSLGLTQNLFHTVALLMLPGACLSVTYTTPHPPSPSGGRQGSPRHCFPPLAPLSLSMSSIF